MATGQTVFALVIIAGGLKGFKLFHTQEPASENTEIPEDESQNKGVLAMAPVESFCCEHGVTHAKEVQAR